MDESATEATHELLIHASRLLAHLWNQYLIELGITYAGHLTLLAAAASPAPHQTALARELQVSTPTMGSALDRLEDQGHVVSYRRQGDTRCRMVRITTQGRRVLRRGQEIEHSLLASAEGLRNQLLQLLPRLVQQPGAA